MQATIQRFTLTLILLLCTQLVLANAVDWLQYQCVRGQTFVEGR